MAEQIQLNPVTIGKDQMDSITELFADESGGAEPILARELTGEVAIDYPNLISYEGLLDGSAPLFDQLDAFKGKKPTERALSNSQIISLFAVDEQGDPIQEGTFLQGAKREGLPSVFSLSGAYFGAKAGMKLQAPIPAVSPWSIAAKVAIPTTTTVLGLFGAYEAGEATTDALFGPEKPISPGSRAAYESGKTAAGAIGWLPLPFMISKNISFGGAQFLDNLAGLTKKVGPLTADELASPGVAKVLQGGKTPFGPRLAAFTERLLSKTGEVARAAPISTAFLETTAGVGASGGAYTAETIDPGAGGTRLALEVTGGIVPSILGARLVAKAPEAVARLKSFAGKFRRGEIDLKGRRQNAAVNRIIDILEAEGEDVDAVIERLASKDFDQVLLDDTGKPITLTAGLKADSPALLAIETALSQTSPGLGKERSAKNIQANNALRNVVASLVATGKPEALQMAGEIAKDVFDASQSMRLTRATDRVLTAFERVRGTDPQSNIKLSETLFDVATQQLGVSRQQERRLWNAVPDLNIDQFVDDAGNVLDQPSFITAWQNSMPRTPEAAADLNTKLRPLANFIDRKSTELGLNADDAESLELGEFFQGQFDDLKGRLSGLSDSERSRQIRQAAESTMTAVFPKQLEPGSSQYNYVQALEGLLKETSDVAAESADAALTVREVQEMRTMALNLGRQLTASQDLNAARVAFNFADGLLDDLNSVSEGANAAYDIARAYSRSLNDTYTRAFAGKALEKGKSGGERIAPELLASKLMTGGGDATYLRVQQINDIGTFAIQNGFEGAEGVAATIRGTQEMIIRNARSAAFDSQTGQVNPASLRKWMASNSELLDTFPALKADLENAETANVLLQQRESVNKSKSSALKGQVTFMDLLSSTTDSPTTAVSRALSAGQKAPMRSLNNLHKVVENAPEAMQEGASSGLKHSILEWAMTKGGATSRSFSPRSMYDNMFSKIPNANANISVADWMLSKNVIKESEVTALKKYLTEMVRLENADAKGTLSEVMETASPLASLYTRIAGSALGGKIAAITGDSQSLIARSAGSNYMQSIFNKVPESMKLDVMSELMENPELLAAMMRKPRTEKESLRLGGRVENLLGNLGFVPIRRAVPQVVSDDSIESEPVQEEVTKPVGPVSSIAPTALPAPQPVPTPAASPTTAMASAPPPPPPAASGPVDRSRFAAMFPEDRALIEGIGSLMG